MILVLAGNEREFNEFLENHEPKNIFRFISNNSDYEGHKKCDLLRIGSYGIILYGRMRINGKGYYLLENRQSHI